MFLIEPERTNVDLHFRVFGVPVRVHPFFWLVALFSGAAPGITPKQTLIWMLALFVSILVHELGHAAAILYYGYRPWVTLYALGGLASYNPGYSSSYESYAGNSTRPSTQTVISLAGPVAGFLFAALVVGVLWVAGRDVEVRFGSTYLFTWAFGGISNEGLYFLLNSLMYVNVFWGLVNLLPVYPLDGGQISRELFLLGNQGRGIEWSLWLSFAVAVGMAIYALVALDQSVLMVMMFVYLAVNSYLALQQYRGRGGYGGGYGNYDDEGPDRDRGW